MSTLSFLIRRSKTKSKSNICSILSNSSFDSISQKKHPKNWIFHSKKRFFNTTKQYDSYHQHWKSPLYFKQYCTSKQMHKELLSTQIHHLNDIKLEEMKEKASYLLNHKEKNTSKKQNPIETINNMNLICHPPQDVIRDALQIMQYFHNHDARNITLHLTNDPPTPNLNEMDLDTTQITYYSGAHLCDHILRSIVPYSHMTIPGIINNWNYPASIIRMHMLTIQAYVHLIKSKPYPTSHNPDQESNHSNYDLLSLPKLAESVLKHLMSLRIDSSFIEKMDKTLQIEYQNSLQIAFNSTLEAYAKSGGGMESAQHAEDLLTRMRTLYDQQPTNHPTFLSYCPPDTVSFNTVIYAWSQIQPDNANHRDEEMGTMIAKRAESILNLMFELTNKDSHFNVKPNLVTLNTVIYTWSRSKSKQASKRVLTLLNNMIKAHSKDSTHPFPNVITFSTILYTLSQMYNKNAPIQAMKLLTQMEHYHTQWYDDVHPNTTVINHVLKVLANHPNPGDACRNLDIIMTKIETNPNTSSTYTLTPKTNQDIYQDPIQTESKLQTLYKIHPNATTYGTAIMIWDNLAKKQMKQNKYKNIEPAEKAEYYLNCLLALEHPKHHDNTYDTQSLFYLNRAINAWQCSKSKNAPDRAESLLKLALNHPNLQPDHFSYARVIRSFAKSKRDDGSKKAYDILMTMEQYYKDGKIDISPDIFCYNNVIYAFCKRNQLKEAEKLLSHMLTKCDEMEQEGKIGIPPDLTTFMTLMSAYTKNYDQMSEDMQKQDTSTISHIEKLYHQIEKLDEKYEDAIYLNAKLLNIIINAHARSHCEDRALKAVDILNRMERLYQSGKNKHVKPDLKTYTSVISAFKGCENAIERTNIILKRIEKQKMETDTVLRKIILNNLASSDSQKADEYLLDMEEKGIEIDNTFYLTLIKAFAEENEVDSARKAETILQRMIDMYIKGNMNIFPNRSIFNTVLSAIALDDSADSEERAENLVNKMEQISAWGMQDATPDRMTFKTLIRIFERSKSGKKAEEVLNRMEDLHNSGTPNIKPDANTYKYVFNAWIRDTKDLSLKKSFKYVQRMNKQFPKILQISDYHALMLKYALSHQPDSIDKILAVLTIFEEKKIPRQSTYTIVLKACQDAAFKLNPSNKYKDEKANKLFRIATDIFRKIIESSDFEVDDLPFALYISICMDVLPDNDQEGSQPSSKERVVTAIFKKACAEGLLSEQVLKKIFPDKTLFMKLTGINNIVSSKVTLKSLPNSWSCNVPQKKKTYV